MSDAATPRLDYDPDTPLDWSPTWHRDVTANPWAGNEPRGFRRAAGIIGTCGHHLPKSHRWRHADAPMTIVPARDDTDAPHDRLEGRWLFAGCYMLISDISRWRPRNGSMP